MRSILKSSVLLISFLTLLLLSASRAQAVSGTWNVDAGGNWSTAGNWASSTIADGTDSTAAFTFDITADRNVSVDTARTIGNVSFEDLSGSSRWILDGPSVLTMSVTSGTPTISTKDVATINATIDGTNGLRFVQDGTLTINSSNTYTGTTTVSSSTLRLGDAGALGGSLSDVEVADGSSGSTGIGLIASANINFARDIHVNNQGTGAINIGGDGVTATFSGDIALDRDVIVSTTSSAVVTFDGVISGTGGINRNGNSNNVAIFNGVNTYTGDTNISFGHIYVGGDALLNTPGALGDSSSTINVGGNGGVLTNGAYTVARDFKINAVSGHFGHLGGVSAHNSVFTGDVEMDTQAELEAVSGGKATFSGQFTGVGGFNKTGAGTVAITGNNLMSGPVNLNNGLLQLGSSTALGTGALSVGSFGTGFQAIGGSQTVANVWDFLRPPTFEGTNDLTFTGAGNLSANFQLGLIFNSTGVTTFSGNLSSSAGFAFAKSGVGDMVLSGNNNYVGVTNVNGGRLIVGSNNALGGTADNTVVANGTTLGFKNSINYTSAEAVTVTGAGVSSQGAINNISGTNTFAGAITTTGATTLGASAGVLHLAGNIGGGNALTITGAGVVALDGTVTTSGVTVQSGASLGGSGTINAAISGAGMVGPGASPGILTATQANPSGGLDFSFELTQFTPDYTNPSASGNDVLRLTHATTPFTSALTAANEINVYFNLNNFTDQNGIYTGGFYTDLSSSFAANISSATIKYYAKATGGAFSYMGNDYDLFSTAYPGASIGLSVVNAPGLQFGSVDGYVMQFSVSGLPTIPEPSSAMLLGLGLIGLARHARRKQRTQG